MRQDLYRIGRRKINLSSVFAGQYVGVSEVDNNIRLVSFMGFDLGFFGKEVNRVEPADENPLAPKVLPMCPVWTLILLEPASGVEPATY